MWGLGVGMWCGDVVCGVVWYGGMCGVGCVVWDVVCGVGMWWRWRCVVVVWCGVTFMVRLPSGDSPLPTRLPAAPKRIIPLASLARSLALSLAAAS